MKFYVYYQNPNERVYKILVIAKSIEDVEGIAHNLVGYEGRYIIEDVSNPYRNACNGFTVEDDTDSFIESSLEI